MSAREEGLTACCIGWARNQRLQRQKRGMEHRVRFEEPPGGSAVHRAGEHLLQSVPRTSSSPLGRSRPQRGGGGGDGGGMAAPPLEHLRLTRLLGREDDVQGTVGPQDVDVLLRHLVRGHLSLP